MAFNRRKFYTFYAIVCLAGYSWLFFSWAGAFGGTRTVCWLKNISGYPCPSCGSTRSLVQLMHGELYEALLYNPLGIVIALIMLVLPIWLMMDLFRQKATFYHFYPRAESLLKKPAIYLSLIILVLLNWAWNIQKGL